MAVTYDSRYINEKLNLNEIIDIKADISVDPDMVMFSAAPVYEFETVKTIQFFYYKFRLSLMNYMNELNVYIFLKLLYIKGAMFN